MRAEPLNLRELFGETYRIGFEESYYAERTRHTIDDPWLQIIPGTYGHIYPHGGELLAVSTHRRGRIAKKLIDLPGVVVVQSGDDGINATFPLSVFDDVASLIGARKRRNVSPEQRERLLSIGAAHRFTAKTDN